MIDKETRAKRLEQVAAKIAELRQEDTIGGVLAFLAGSPFADDHAADFLINALVATSTPEALAQAYNLPSAAAQVLHGAAVAAVTVKGRPPKNASGLLSTVASILEKVKAERDGKPAAEATPSDDTPDPDCQCSGCKANRFMEDLKKHAVPDGKGNLSIAVEFGTKTPEEIKELNTRFMAEVGKGRSPVDVAQELGGRIANYDDVLKAEKEGRIQAWHVDGDGNPLH